MLGRIICIIVNEEAVPQEINWTKISIKSKSCKGFQNIIYFQIVYKGS